ncbi:hypothetical protein [Halosegnis longus]|uniref:hypothetical protein n=1 Tax=Halosegnis longus TaxID=2216012 RepID=UPI00129DCA12|nr:hypothetical protein [Halosegnis longus]
MAFPRTADVVPAGENRLIVHNGSTIILVDDDTVAVIDGSTLVLEQRYETHSYARTDAQRIAQRLMLKGDSPTEVRRSLEGSTEYGRVSSE